VAGEVRVGLKRSIEPISGEQLRSRQRRAAGQLEQRRCELAGPRF
jgi:hypothetical protein